MSGGFFRESSDGPMCSEELNVPGEVGIDSADVTLQEIVYAGNSSSRTTWLQDEAKLAEIQGTKGFGLMNLPPGYPGDRILVEIYENQRYSATNKCWTANMSPDADGSTDLRGSKSAATRPASSRGSIGSPTKQANNQPTRAAYSHKDGSGVYFGDRAGHPVVSLPMGWHWVDDWRIIPASSEPGHVSEWEYAGDWNADPYEWKDIENEVMEMTIEVPRSRLEPAQNPVMVTKTVATGHQVRRRKWVRVMSDSREQKAEINAAGKHRRVALGGDHFVLLGIEGKVYTLGDNSSLQCGHNDQDDVVQTPMAVPALLSLRIDAVKVAAGDKHTVVLLGDGTVWTCGDNSYGQLAVDPRSYSPQGNVVSSIQGYSVVSVTAGANHSLFLTSGGTVLSCGDNSQGQLAQGQGVKQAYRPRQIKGDWKKGDAGNDFIMISAGGNCGAAVTKSGRAYTWGYAAQGSLGRKLVRRTAEGKAKDLPQMAAGLVESLAKLGVKVSSIATSTERTLFLDIAGSVYASAGVDQPVQCLSIPEEKCVKQVATGTDGRCAFVLEDGTLLAANSTHDDLRSIDIEEPVMEVACGSLNSLAITVHGVIVAFGQDSNEVMAMPGNNYHGELKVEASDVYAQIRMGRGELYALDGSTYTGQFSQNKEHGQGQLTTADGDEFMGTWKNGQRTSLKATFANGSTYSGPFKGFLPHGYGIWNGPDGDTYIGEFTNGEFDGYGTQTLGTGESYEGKMVKSERHGFGVCTWPYEDGEGVKTKYQGQWQHNAIEGYGIMTSDLLGVYTGSFVNGQRSGHGTMQWNQGEHKGCLYDGEWKDGEMHGHGMYSATDGSVYEGGWYDGERYGPGCLVNSAGELHTVEYNDLHEVVKDELHESAVGHLDTLKSELAQCEADLEAAKEEENVSMGKLEVCEKELQQAEEQKAADDAEFAKTTEESQRCEKTLDFVSKQVNTAASQRSTSLHQKQGQLETFSLANMDTEAAALMREISELQAKNTEERAAEQSKLEAAQQGYDTAVTRHAIARQKKEQSSKIAKAQALEHDFAHKKLLAAKAAKKRLNEMIDRTLKSIEVAEHWRRQEELELGTKRAARAEKTSLEQLSHATEHYAETQKDVQHRTIVYNHRQRKVDAAQEKLHQAELDVEAAEQKSDRLHRESIDHLTNESQAAYTKSRLRLQERTEIRLSREEELANAQVKLGRAKQALDKLQGISATAQGRMNAIHTVVQKHRNDQQAAQRAMAEEQEKERQARLELQALEAVELTEVVEVVQPKHAAVTTQAQGKRSGWFTVKAASKFINKTRSTVENHPRNIPPEHRRDALSEVCGEELTKMHLSLEEPDISETERQLQERWTTKYKYKYMFKYKARAKAQELSTHALSMLGAVGDPMDPAVCSPPATPPQAEPSSTTAPPASPAIHDGADIEFAVGAQELDAHQVEEICRQAQKQVAKLQREFNLLPLARKVERGILAPIVKHRRCEAHGWTQILHAIEANGVEQVQAFLAKKEEVCVWSGNAAWVGRELEKSFKTDAAAISSPGSPRVRGDSTPKIPWNNSITKDNQKAYDLRCEAKRNREAQARAEQERRAMSPENQPASPDLLAQFRGH